MAHAPAHHTPAGILQSAKLHAPSAPTHRALLLQVEPKRQELAAANAKLQEANTMLAAVQQKVRQHNRMASRG